MRTTIEINDDDGARLLEIAAKRGEKGLSAVLAEAIDAYLAVTGQDQDSRRAALALRGSLTEEEAEELYEGIRRLRES